MNERIRAREVRVIGDEGEQIGIMAPFEALKMARERNLDLVEISPTAQPPVCRIMDYGKFLYQNEKREREAKKKQKTITVKEVKFRINVDDHDYDTKKNHVLRFLDEGDKVKATIFFRGREMTRQSLGRQILERLIKDVEHKGIGGISAATGRQHAAPDPGAEERSRAERTERKTQRLRSQRRHHQRRAARRQRRAAFSCQHSASAKSVGVRSRNNRLCPGATSSALRTENRELGTDFNAKTENTQRRCQALQENGDRQNQASQDRFASHPELQSEEAQETSG